MTTITVTQPPAAVPPVAAHGRWRWAALGLLALLLVGVVVHNVTSPRAVRTGYAVPQSAAMEDRLGVRFSRVAVVGDGGLITLSYVVLDSEKASRFQSDVAHPPVLTSDLRPGRASRVSLMKQGHTLREGEQYYLVYQDPADLVRHGDTIDIHDGHLVLRHVPVW